MIDKKSFRKQIISLRSEMDSTIRKQAEKAIYQRLFASEHFQNAQTICSFVSFSDEIEMQPINQDILDQGKTLLLPYITPEKTMVFHLVKDLSALKRNHYGILEPDPLIHPLFDIHAVDLVLTPGVAFDESGYRVGYGAGFYDRFFSKLNKAIPRIGIAYELQVVTNVPKDDYDQPLTHLMTEFKTRTF